MTAELCCSWQDCVLVTVTEVLKSVKYVSVPTLFIHNGAACDDSAIIVYTTEYRLLMVFYRMNKKCTDKLQGVNLCCSSRNGVVWTETCCSIVFWVTAYRKSNCIKYPSWTSMGGTHLNGDCVIHWQIPGVVQIISNPLCIIVGRHWLL